MSFVVAFLRKCIPFLLASSLFALDYQPGQSIHREVMLQSETIDCRLTADLTVVESDPLKLKVILQRIQSNGPIYAGDTDEEPHDSRHAWWKAKRLKRALEQPFYITIEGNQCLLADDDREIRFALWPELLKAIDNGWLFSLLFGPNFVLEGHEVQEGLTFLYNNRALTVQSVTDDEIIATLDDTTQLIWNTRNPLIFHTNQAVLSIDSH